MQFRRRGWYKHKRLGKGKRRMVGWKRPKGRDNKMRESKKGKPPLVSIGYKKQRENIPIVTVYNVNGLQNAVKNSIFIMGKVGKKNKIKIAQMAKEIGIKFENINLKKILENKK